MFEHRRDWRSRPHNYCPLNVNLIDFMVCAIKKTFHDIIAGRKLSSSLAQSIYRVFISALLENYATERIPDKIINHPFEFYEGNSIDFKSFTSMSIEASRETADENFRKHANSDCIIDGIFEKHRRVCF